MSLASRQSAPHETGPPPGCPAHGDDAVPLHGPRFAEDDRQGLYRELRRQHGALAPVTLPGDIPAWLVLGYREIHRITGDPELFTRDSAVWNQWDAVPSDWPLTPMVGRQPSILYEMGERHRRRHALVSDSLGDVDPAELRGHAESFADRLIDEFCGRGTADLVAEYAARLPALVLHRLYGFPDDRAAALVADIDTMLDGGEEAVPASLRLRAEMTTLLHERAGAPGADVATRMQHHAHAEDFTPEELVEDLVVTIVAGQQPTADWIGNSLRLMLTDDRFAASLSGGRHSIGEAMNEVLWEEPPSQNIAGRWATRDTQLAGRNIRRGDLLVLSVAAANADPQVRPDQSVLTGGNSAFFSFGHGDHRCPYPAQEIAEGIALTAIEVLLDRLPDVDLGEGDAERLAWRPSPWVRGLRALPVHFTPTGVSGTTA